MKKKTFALAIVITMLCILVAGGVLAKYISVLHADGEAQIARWSFRSSLKNNGQAVTNSTIQLQNTYNKETLTNGKVAPGTAGEFSIQIDGTGSDVGIEYQVEFKEKEGKEVKPSNLKFSLDGENYVGSIHELEETLQGEITADEINKVKDYTVFWQWLYETEPLEQNDLLDTKEANLIQNYAFDIVITGTQIHPS